MRGQKRANGTISASRWSKCPSLKEGEALVQVEACSVNRADLLQRRGLYPPPPGASQVLGLDFAGFVVKRPPASAFKESDRVFGIVAGGGYGRYVAVPADHLVPIPENLSFTEAAAAAEVFFTAYYNLFIQAGIKAGDALLLHGGGSGVGTAAIQLCSSIGAMVIITAGSEDKVKRALDLGASAGINYKQEDFAERVLDITRGVGRGYHSRLDWSALFTPAPGDPENKRAARHHRFDGRERGRNKPCPGRHQKAKNHRLRFAQPVERGEGRDRAGVHRDCAPAAQIGSGEAHNRPNISNIRSGGCSPVSQQRRAFRKNRAHVGSF